MVSVLSRREIKTKTWIAFYSHLLAQTHTLLNIHIFAGQTTFFFLCFTSFDSFIWTSTLVVPVSPVSGLSLVLIILFLVWKLLLFSVNCNHISFSRELKKEEESEVSLTSWWFQLTHTWSGWWTIVKASFWQKLRACQISSVAPESFFGACCQCAEVKPRGWTQNRWGLHETWSLTVPCHFYFSFQFSGWCWITSLIKFSTGKKNLS